MRILLVSDLHYTLPQLDWVVGAADSFDVVAIAGDHLDISSSVSLDAQIVVIQNYFALLHDRTRLIVSSGNHDLTGVDANGERAALWLNESGTVGAASDGDTLALDDAVMVTVCPWWDGPLGRQAVVAQLARDATRRPATWIWMYHWPPVDSPTSWTGRRHYGDPDLLGWIGEYRPQFVFSGHVHEPPFKPDGGWADYIDGTWIFNPGRQTGQIPTRIEIDLDTDLKCGEAAWFSLLGVETVDLSATAAPPRSLF